MQEKLENEKKKSRKKSWFVDSGLGGASDEPDTYTFYTKP